MLFKCPASLLIFLSAYVIRTWAKYAFISAKWLWICLFFLLVLLLLVLCNLKLYQVDTNLEVVHFLICRPFYQNTALFKICSDVCCFKITIWAISIYKTSLINACIVFSSNFYFQVFYILVFKLSCIKSLLRSIWLVYFLSMLLTFTFKMEIFSPFTFKVTTTIIFI